MDSNGDAVNSIADGSWTKRISKNGGAFAAMTVVLTFLENGFYSVPLSTAHSDTAGILTMTFTAAGVKQVNVQFRVQARLVDDLAFPATSGRSLAVAATGHVGLDWANIASPTTAQGLTGTTISALSAAGNQAIWDVLDAAIVLASSIGIRLKTFITGDSFGRLGAPVGASISADLQTRATPAQVNTEVDTALADVNLDHLVGTPTGIPAVPAGTYLDQIMDDGTATYNRSIHSLQAAIDNSADMADFGILLNTTVASLTSQTVFVLAAGSDINESYRHQVIALYDVSNNQYPSVRRAVSYIGASRTLTLDRAPDFTIATGDQVRIFAAQSVSMEELVGPVATVVANGSNTTTSFQITVPSVNEIAANWWKRGIFSFDLGSSLAGQEDRITAFNQTTGFVTVGEGFTAIPTAGDTARMVTR